MVVAAVGEVVAPVGVVVEAHPVVVGAQRRVFNMESGFVTRWPNTPKAISHIKRCLRVGR